DRANRSALLVAPTGGGKTLAGFLPSLVDLADKPRQGLHTLYISPLKALAVDIHRNLMQPIAEIGLAIAVETRTGDTPAAKRQRSTGSRPPRPGASGGDPGDPGISAVVRAYGLAFGQGGLCPHSTGENDARLRQYPGPGRAHLPGTVAHQR